MSDKTTDEATNNTPKKNIFIASNNIDENNIFLNGLNQNILILYDMFELIGYKSYLIQHRAGANDNKNDMFKRYDIVYTDDIIKNPIPVHLYIEIGMSLDTTCRQYLRSIGAKITKIYLGNILNIDIETIQSFNDMYFTHHVVGELDDIWMSPHYKQNLDYGVVLNRVSLQGRGLVVPYVWDPCFITQYGSKHPKWVAPQDWTKSDIIICDPNISFQKSYFYSLLLAEAYSKKYPEWRGNVVVVNGDKLSHQINATGFILENLSLYKNKRIVLVGRKSLHEIITEYPSATFITCQWNNSFNYMTLELMYCGFPILHNSDGWEDFGYYYSVNKWSNSIETLHGALKNHKTCLKMYENHVANLMWKHSINNPENQKEWVDIIETV